MPAIRSYTNDDNVLQPDQGGPAATAQAAIRLNALGLERAADIRRTGAAWGGAFDAIDKGLEKVGKVVSDWQTHNELNVFNAALMNTHAELDQDWAKTRKATDPNQPAGADWLRQNATPKLDKLMDGMSTEAGRRHAESVLASAKMHYLHSTTVDDQMAAGEGVVRNMNVVVDGATLRSQRDFSTVQYNGELIKNSFDAAIQNGNLSPAAAGKLRDARDKAVLENNLAGLKGAADRNPGAFMAQLKAGAFDNMGIGAKEAEQLQHYAKSQERAHAADARNAAVDAQIATAKKSEAEMQKIANGVLQPDGTLKMPSMTDILNNPKLTFGDRTQAIRFYGALAKEPAVKSDVRTYGDLLGRIGKADNPLAIDDITDAVEDKKLTPKDGQKLLDKIQRQDNAETRRLDQGEKGWDAAVRKELNIDNQFGPIPPGAGFKYESIRRWSEDYVKEMRRQGVSEHDIFDTDGKQYIGRQQAILDLLKQGSGQPPLDIIKRAQEKPAAPAPVPGGAPVAPPTSLKLPPKPKPLDDIMGGKK